MPKARRKTKVKPGPAHEAAAREAAISDILRVIASSPGDLQPVFDTILDHTIRLTGGHVAALWQYDGAGLRYAASLNSPAEAVAYMREHPLELGDWNPTPQAALERRVMNVLNVFANPKYRPLIPAGTSGKRPNAGTVLAVPLVREDELFGVITVWRYVQRLFSDREIELVKTFTAQAVVAIQNVRLFNATKESLEQQTAMSEVLRVIAASPSDVQPVLEAVAQRARRICAAGDARVLILAGDRLRHAAGEGDQPMMQDFVPLEGSVTGRAVRERRPIQIDDVTKLSEDEYPFSMSGFRELGTRMVLAVPLLREDRALGAILLRRQDVRPFTPKQIGLLKTFADQAAIAIENVRLFNETKEALQRQTATARILGVISSSPTQVQPVLDAVAASAAQLWEGSDASVHLVEGEQLRLVAHSGPVPDAGIGTLMPIDGRFISGRAVLERRTIHVHDSLAVAAEYPGAVERSRKHGVRTILVCPLLREGRAVGTIVVRRTEVKPFTDQQVQLVKSFADQSVIAIENARLFNETKEALEQQTATADVLRVISSSPATVQPVFEAILDKATDLCEAQLGILFLREGDVWRMVSHRGASAEAQEAHREIRPGPNTGLGRMRSERRPVHIEDLLADADTAQRDPVRMSTIQKLGARTFLAVPLLKDGDVIGAVVIYRKEVRPFGEAQIRLVGTFADQAVIAIENVRLFNETKEALERQTATADVLKVISASPTDVAPVFDAILKSAVALCDAELAAMFSYDGKLVDMVAAHNWPREAQEYFSKVYPSPPSPKFLSGRTILSKSLVEIPDAAADEHYDPRSVVTGHWRRMVGVPMLRDGEPLGAIMVAWREPGQTPRRQVELLQTFADQAAIAIENVRLFHETREALEQQTATAEVLKVISASRTDVAPVFDAILKSAVSLCDAELAAMFSYDGKQVDMVATHNWPREALEYFAKVYPAPPSPAFLSGRTILSKSLVHITDAADDPHYDRTSVITGHWRRMLGVPLLREGEPMGAMVVAWRDPGETPRRQVELLQTFADQAAIAIENVRLFNETKRSLEQQTAVSEILRVISSSPDNLQPVFDTIVRNFAALCGTAFGSVFTSDGGLVHVAAGVGFTPEPDRAHGAKYPVRVDDPSVVSARTIHAKKTVHIQDTLTDPHYGPERAAALGLRRLIGVPMLRDGRALGAIVAGWKEPGATPKHHEDLLRTFADQAVIAIENVRLFHETKEALEQQTATAEILKVIASSTTELQPVFDVIVERAVRLCGASFGRVYRYDGALIQMVASHGLSAGGLGMVQQVFPRPATDDTIVGRVIVARRPYFLHDIARDDSVPALSRQMIEALNTRSQVTIPMLRAGEPIGAITMGWATPGGFDDQKVALLQTFADQAVIAIENARLFNETSEALEQQTAISEVLRVISSSPADVQPVLDAVAERAARICAAQYTDIVLVDHGGIRIAAGAGNIPRTGRDEMVPLDRATVMGRSIIDRTPIHIADVLEGGDEFPRGREMALQFGHRTLLAVPLIRENRALGTILVRRTEVRPFEDKYIALLKTFADQAAIAIENVRLFNETKEALEQQKASADVLAVISGSIADTQPVFEKILDSCQRLFAGRNVGINVVGDDGRVHIAAYKGFGREELERSFPVPLTMDSGSGAAILQGTVVHYPDCDAPGVPEYARRAGSIIGNRSVLFAPMLWEGKGIGAIFVGRSGIGSFSGKEIALLKTFADQAAIAIQNARLFREIQEKSAQLEIANKHKSEFLANMSHELRTPLNAIIGFSEVLSEQMFGELNEKQTEYMRDIHESGRHLLSLINDILDLSKIEAGRMELELSTFHLPTALSNAMTLIRERAQRHGIELELDVDQRLGEFTGDERKFKQIMLNLLSNAVKFTPDGGRVAVSATNGADRVEIAVKDTGIGIAPEDQAAVFEEFKQVGRDRLRKAEGTGLGLALTKRFVELHGGEIRLASEPGKGSTFSVSLPLAGGGSSASSA